MERGEVKVDFDNLGNLVKEIKRRESVCLFVDNSNLFGAIQNLQWLSYGKRVDYIKLREFLADGRSVNRANFYYSEPPFPREGMDRSEQEWKEMVSAAQKRQGFYYVLQKAGYTTVCLPQREQENGLPDKQLDIELVYDMCALSRTGKFNTFILVAGDEDYARAVQKVRQDTGVAVEVAFFQESCSYRLRQAANRFINLSEPEAVEEIFRTT